MRNIRDGLQDRANQLGEAPAGAFHPTFRLTVQRPSIPSKSEWRLKCAE
jgi:hypothetical protein